MVTDQIARRYFVGFVSDHTLHYSTIGYELVEDRYERTSNVGQIHSVEDRYFATRVRAQLGYASEGLGSDRNAVMMNLFAQTGFGGTKKSF